jgi:lipopolysaccharide biosynthesis glycosyltransferase
MATLLELKQKLAEEEKALKAKYAEKLAAAKKREQRAETLEAKKRRKLEDHGKYMLAGIVLADMKKKKDASLLTGFLKTLTRKNDIDAIQALIDLVLKPEAAESSRPVSPSSKPQPKTEAPQKS